MEGHQEWLYMHSHSRTNTKEKMEQLLNGIGDLVSKDTIKAEVTQRLDLFLTGKICSQASYCLHAYSAQVKSFENHYP